MGCNISLVYAKLVLVRNISPSTRPCTRYWELATRMAGLPWCVWSFRLSSPLRLPHLKFLFVLFADVTADMRPKLSHKPDLLVTSFRSLNPSTFGTRPLPSTSSSSGCVPPELYESDSNASTHATAGHRGRLRCGCGAFGRFDLAALCGCRTLNFCLFCFVCLQCFLLCEELSTSVLCQHTLQTRPSCQTKPLHTLDKNTEIDQYRCSTSNLTNAMNPQPVCPKEAHTQRDVRLQEGHMEPLTVPSAPCLSKFYPKFCVTEHAAGNHPTEPR